MCSRYFFVGSLLLVFVSSVASTKDSPTGIKQLSLGNKNRIKSKHLEMWDIVQSIIERKATLDRIAKVHNQHTYDMQLEDNSKVFRKHGPNHRANRLNSSNYKRQNYKMNIEMSTMLLKEARKLSELEKVCQDII